MPFTYKDLTDYDLATVHKIGLLNNIDDLEIDLEFLLDNHYASLIKHDDVRYIIQWLPSDWTHKTVYLWLAWKTPNADKNSSVFDKYLEELTWITKSHGYNRILFRTARKGFKRIMHKYGFVYKCTVTTERYGTEMYFIKEL